MNIKNLFQFKEKDMNKSKDPVCGMGVNLKTSKFKKVFHGKEYAFCSEGCKTTFELDPVSYE